MKHISPIQAAGEASVKMPTRRALAKQQTRAKVLAAARRLFSEHGYEGATIRDIAAAIGRAFGLPVTSIAAGDVQGHFGWIGTFFGMNLAATSTATRELLGWAPEGPTLIEDLDAGAYRARTPVDGGEQRT